MATKIEWAQSVWNPTKGCSKVSPGCNNCYAIRMAHRLAHMPHTAERYAGLTKKTKHGLEWTGAINLDYDALHLPVKNKKPTIYFVDSMSDIFHAGVPFEFIDLIFAAMACSPQHVFIVLTKRPERALEWFNISYANFGHRLIGARDRVYNQTKSYFDSQVSSGLCKFPLPNVIMGVSIESQKYMHRAATLMQIPAVTRCVSAEPLLGKLDLPLFNQPKIDWVIAGGESGHGARPVKHRWVGKIMADCFEANTAFFFKQWGEYLPLIQWHLQPFVTKNKTIYGLNEREQVVDFDDLPPNLQTENNAFYKVGKKASGNKLNHHTYQQFPKVITDFFKRNAKSKNHEQRKEKN